MVTVAWWGVPSLTLPGNDDELIMSIKYTSISNVLSLIIGILNATIVTPAGNVAVYGPEL